MNLENQITVNGHSGERASNGSEHANIMNASSVPVDERIKRRAKRPSKYLQKEAGVNGHSNGSVVTTKGVAKNSRKPRNGYGRGLPKKGGGGGKGVWGKPGSELHEALEDPEDPNYDSDSLDHGDVALRSVIPELNEEQIQKAVEPLILEYFDHGDTGEVALSLDELNIGDKRFMILTIAIETAMDHKPSHREMTSVLISDLYMELLSQSDVAKGFDMLLKNLPDLVLDTPEAPTILGNFIARVIADDCLPPKFVQGYKGKVECSYARDALKRAELFLNMEHGLVRLDNIWGVGGGRRPVKYLVKKMVLLLQEYMSSNDALEAQRCLVELEVPHFHHELVFEAVVMAIEKSDEETAERICRLLKTLYAAVIVTPDQMKEGFIRVFDNMPDISLDVPAAYPILEGFVERCLSAGIVSGEVARQLPARGRKRFVSEGDGGRIKEDNGY